MQTILVIEDDRAIRLALVDILELEGYRALSAEDGIAGIATARQERPNLIICDIIMPYLDGYAVLSELRKHAETATIPLIFLTARTTRNDVRQGMNLGADDYLTKPFRAEELLRAIQSRLERQTRLAEKLQGRVDELHNNLMNILPHELNTPLHGILAGIEYLKDEYNSLEPSDIEELLYIVHQSALRMRRLVSNSLLHADLGAMRVKGESRPFDQKAAPILVASLIELAATQEAIAATREADLYLQLEEATVGIFPNHIAKIAEELLSNAFKYSKPGTPIAVTSYCEGKVMVLTIKDSGRGMTGEEVEAIGSHRQFQRKQYEQQGLGLGLVIVQRLLELYQGELLIESVLGEHTHVRVVLPLAQGQRSPNI